MIKHSEILALDKKDKLAKFKAYFYQKKMNLIYLDGNSLGKLPVRSSARMQQVLKKEWGENLIDSWNEWLYLSQKIGTKIAEHLLGANKDEVIISDNVTINIYKILNALVDQGKTIFISNQDNFPTDNYLLQGLAKRFTQLKTIFIPSHPIDGISIEMVEKTLKQIDGKKSVFLFSHVDYKSAALANMPMFNDLIHHYGGQIIWDLSHSVGAVEIELANCASDYAVGCTYKYLNSGPGAPAFIYINQKHLEKFQSPIAGWFSHKDQFSFADDYQASCSMQKVFTGSPSIIATSLIEPSIDIFIEAGMKNIRQKSILQSNLLIKLIDQHLANFDFKLVSPINSKDRGSHIALKHPKAYLISLALRDKNIIPDFRPPNLLRLAIAPLYNSFEDLYQFVLTLKEIMQTKSYEHYQNSTQLVP